jgi:hypothetical protein
MLENRPCEADSTRQASQCKPSTREGTCTLNMTRFCSMTQIFHHLQNIYNGLKRIWKLDNIVSHALTQNPKQIRIIIPAKLINIFSKLQHFFFTHLACFATDPSLLSHTFKTASTLQNCKPSILFFVYTF